MPHPPHWLALRCQPPDGADTWLGSWALQFTPRVLWLEDAWLLDVAPTLRLWGGLDRLMPRMTDSLKEGSVCRGVQVALGPTARAALARWRAEQWWAQGDGLPTRAQLLTLPLHTLTPARAHTAVLARLGVHTWGQLARLPRDGVSRRWGAVLLRGLDEALGRAPETHAWLSPPLDFDASLTWPHHLDTTDQLMPPVRQLLAALHGWLVLRQRAALAVRWSWQHDKRRYVAHTGGFELRTSQPAQQPGHWLLLTAEHLVRQTLEAPVVSIRLQTIEHVPFAAPSADWVSASAALQQHPAAIGWPVLLERLRARLGDGAVTHWQPQDTHVPDAMQAAACPTGQPVTARRLPSAQDALLPTWLLPVPQPLSMRGHRPCYQGELELLVGPQRLELAHWPDAAVTSVATEPTTEPVTVQGHATVREQADAQPTLRDYFVARSPIAGLLWVFRQQGAAEDEPAWFLHGRFA